MSVTTSTPFRHTPIARALANLNWVPLEYPQNLEAAIFLIFVASQRNGTLTNRPIRQSRPQVQEVAEETQLIEAAMQPQTNEYAQMNGVSTQWKLMPKPPDPLLSDVSDVSCSPRLQKNAKNDVMISGQTLNPRPTFGHWFEYVVYYLVEQRSLTLFTKG